MVKQKNMKKLLSKIKIHPLTLIILFILLHEGLIKYVYVISIILFVHEIGHLLFMLTFKRHINSITILPFGGLIKLDSDLSTNIYEDLLISIGGIFTQSILFYLTSNELLLYYNKLIIIFNLLPICPLDGYKIIKLLLELIMPYKKTFVFVFGVSIIIIILVVLLNIELIYSNILMFSFLIYSTFKEYSYTKYYMNRFYIERMMKLYKFKSIININKKEEMYKNKTNIIKGQREDIYLRNEYLK